MGDVSATVAAWGGLGGFAAALTLLGPLRALWRKGHNRRVTHRLDHEGRPARIDPSTGRVIEPAQPGIASMISDMHSRQLEIGANVTALTESRSDNAAALTEIRGLLEKQSLENDKRHAENAAESAKIREQVVELRGMAKDAALQAKDAAGHAARLDQQQQELVEHVHAEFEQQRAWTGAYVTALGEMGVHVAAPEQSASASPR